MDFSETIAASDLKVCRSRHLIEYMKVCIKVLKVKVKKSKIQTGFSQKLLCQSKPNFYGSFHVQGNENLMT